MIAVDELFDAIPAINRSFHHVKAVSKAENAHGDDFIQFSEFRLFLQTLRQFFEYFQAFNRLDVGEDQRVDKEEFTSDKMKEAIEKVSRDTIVRKVVFTELYPSSGTLYWDFD